MKNESVKKSFEKSKNFLEEKRKTQAKNLHKKDTHVYNNCYEFRSRAIKNADNRTEGKSKRDNIFLGNLTQLTTPKPMLTTHCLINKLLYFSQISTI